MRILIGILLFACWPMPAGSAGGRTIVSVFIVRGSVSGSSTGSYGAFARNGVDTTWTKLTPSNIITFGLGHFERGTTRRLYVAGGNGVLRSTDEGRSWRVLTSWQTMEILSVALDPADSTMILGATPRGVYKSTDDGATWALKEKGMARWFVQKLLRDVGTPGTYYAAVEDGLYRSTDRGESWKRLPLPADQIQVIAQNPVAPAFLGAASEDRGIWLSHDGGRSWQQCADLRRETVYALRFSPDGKEIYAAGWKTGIWRSRDGGKKWTRLWNDPAVEAVFDVIVDPDDPAHVLAGTDGQGVYESHDAGRSWHRAGLMGAKVKQIEIIP
jgi:photosystem II stability/assembly factor-like uncharacterized protein